MSVLPNLLKAILTVSFLANQQIYKSDSNTDPGDIYCYSTDNSKPQREHYALQTPHTIDYTETFKLPECIPKKIWIVTRHGTRYPSDNSLKNLAENLPIIQNQVTKNKYLCESDYKLLKNWEMNEYEPACSLTNPQGINDLQRLAKGYRKMYPTLFPAKYSSKNYKFAHSSAARTKQSCAAFTEELFGPAYLLFDSRNWITDNLKLRPWMNCPLFSEYARDLEAPNSQSNLFKNTTHFTKLQYHVSRRLGLNNLLTGQQIEHLWDECRYQETYDLKKLSPFCAAFDLHEAKILEYLSDLSLYYKLSYGHTLNTKLPCATIKDMIETMADNNKSSNKVTVYFSHAELLLMMLSALGAHKDATPLLYNNYETMKNRQFRSSNLVPYASNIAAVKYYCPATNDNKILMLLNKKPLILPWCKHGSVCTIDEMKNYFNNSTMANCPNDICGPNFGKESIDSKYEQENSC